MTPELVFTCPGISKFTVALVATPDDVIYAAQNRYPGPESQEGPFREFCTLSLLSGSDYGPAVISTH